MRTVRDATFEVLIHLELTTMFANPGSTEIPLIVDLPPELSFVLALHEGSVVGMATGWAIGAGRPALVLLHTTAGLGNAVGALATARVNRAPLVVIVGQQDRRHIVAEPFLSGQLDGIAGSYPVWIGNPARAADVPATVARAYHEAQLARGPALVMVPMNDWLEPADEVDRLAAPRSLRTSAGIDEKACAEVSEAISAATNPVLITGAGADDASTWCALVELADNLQCPVWQEPFGARAGFPQDSEHFVGHLPSTRSDVRESLRGHDLVLLVGAPALRQYGYEKGPLFGDDVRVVLVTDDGSEAAYSAADLAVVTPLPEFCRQLAIRVPQREAVVRTPPSNTPVAPIHRGDDVLLPGDVFSALAERLPNNAVIVEETPSSRLQMQTLLPARQPLGFLSAAMGGLGFAMPAATGLKMARPDRVVVAIVGDGSSLYAIQALWSAQRYGVGVLFIVLSNGGYVTLDQLAARVGGTASWPSFEDIRVHTLAAGLGCRAVRVTTYDALVAQLDEIATTLDGRTEPFLLDVVVAP